MIDLVQFGFISKATGTKGAMKLTVEKGFESVLESIKFVFISQQAFKVPYKVKALKAIDDYEFHLFLNEHDNPQLVSKFRNSEVFVARKDLPEYWRQTEGSQEVNNYQYLVDFNVYNVNNQLIGVVIELVDYGLHTNAILQSGNQKIAVPIHDDLIVSESIPEKKITLELPEGIV